MTHEIQTAVQIANMALRVLQSRTIESLDDENDPVAQTVKMYYDNVLRRCLAAYPWAFSIKEGQLQRFPKSPTPRWPCAFHLPVDSVNLIWLSPNSHGDGHFRDYELYGGDLVLTNANELWALYQYAAPVPTYPAHFTEFMVTSLIEELAGVFGHNLNTQAIYQRRKDGPFGALGIAIQQEQRQNPPKISPRPSCLSVVREW